MASPGLPERLSLREMEDRVGKLPAKVELVNVQVGEAEGMVRMYQRDGDGWRLLSDGPGSYDERRDAE